MTGKEFDRADLCRAIAEKTVVTDHSGGGEPYPEDYRIQESTAMDVIELFGQVLAEALAEHGRVEIHEIGVFRLENRAAREGVTPGGEAWETPERKKVEFDAAPALASAISEITQTTIY